MYDNPHPSSPSSSGEPRPTLVFPCLSAAAIFKSSTPLPSSFLFFPCRWRCFGVRRRNNTMATVGASHTRRMRMRRGKSNATCQCCQLAIFNARFHKTGIAETCLALKIFNFIWHYFWKSFVSCLAFNFFLFY